MAPFEQRAAGLIQRGYPVFPCDRATKRPLVATGFKAATKDPDIVAGWSARFPDALVGVPTGNASGLMVLDADPDGLGWMAGNDELRQGSRLHKTPRGFHSVFAMPDLDIRCSAGQIAPGIDVRANGGYVIWWPVEGLETTGKLTDIKPPPEALLRLLETRADAPDEAPGGEVERAEIDELRSLLPAWDPDADYQTWCNVGMALHSATSGAEAALALWDEWSRQSAKYKGLSDLEAHWRSFRPDGGITVGYLRQQAAAPDAFPDMSAGDPPRRKLLMGIDELLREAARPQEFLVQRLYERNFLYVVVGAPKSGKSAITLDQALCLATGREWAGRKVLQVPVLYIAGEGHAGIGRRVKAWALHHGVNLAGIPFEITRSAVPVLGDRDALNALAGEIREFIDRHGGRPAFVVWDTVNRNFGPGDENSATDMGEFVKRLDSMRAALRCTMVLVHHTPVAAPDRPRGSSALLGAVDGLFTVTLHDDIATWRSAAQKEMAAGEGDAYFRMTGVELPTMSNMGDASTAVVATHVQGVEVSSALPQNASERAAYDALGELGGRDGWVALDELRRRWHEVAPVADSSKRKVWARVLEVMQSSWWARVEGHNVRMVDYDTGEGRRVVFDEVGESARGVVSEVGEPGVGGSAGSNRHTERTRGVRGGQSAGSKRDEATSNANGSVESSRDGGGCGGLL